MSPLGNVFEELERRTHAETLEASFAVPGPDHEIFDGHFAGDPLLPAWVQLALVQGLLESWVPDAAMCALLGVRFREAVRPNEELSVKLERTAAGGRFQARTGPRTSCTGQFVLAPRTNLA